MCQRLFFNKIAGNFIKKESLAQVFSCEFCEISKNIFFTEHLRTTASVICLHLAADCSCVIFFLLRLFIFIDNAFSNLNNKKSNIIIL